MPELTRQSEQELLQQMEALRQELDHMLKEHPELLGSQQVYELSSRLDALIARYMQAKAQQGQLSKK